MTTAILLSIIIGITSGILNLLMSYINERNQKEEMKSSIKTEISLKVDSIESYYPSMDAVNEIIDKGRYDSSEFKAKLEAFHRRNDPEPVEEVTKNNDSNKIPGRKRVERRPSNPDRMDQLILVYKNMGWEIEDMNSWSVTFSKPIEEEKEDDDDLRGAMREGSVLEMGDYVTPALHDYCILAKKPYGFMDVNYHGKKAYQVDYIADHENPPGLGEEISLSAYNYWQDKGYDFNDVSTTMKGRKYLVTRVPGSWTIEDHMTRRLKRALELEDKMMKRMNAAEAEWHTRGN